MAISLKDEIALDIGNGQQVAVQDNGDVRIGWPSMYALMTKDQARTLINALLRLEDENFL